MTLAECHPKTVNTELLMPLGFKRFSGFKDDANFTFRNRYRYRRLVDADCDPDSENKIIGKSVASGVLK